MKTIEQIAAEILVECGYAITKNGNNMSVLVGNGLENHWEINDFSQDTLEGRRQSDAIEGWLFSSYKSASTWCGNLWDDSRAAVYDLGGERHQWRLDRIKWCLEQLRNEE